MLKRALTILFWLVFAIALGLYFTMLGWSLPAITNAAGGLTPFDMRPAGYSFEEAKAFLAALPADMTEFYRQTQIGLLDKYYPAFLAATLFLAIGLLAPKKLKFWGWVLALVAIPGAVFDYMENTNLNLMLFLGPDNINMEIVARASSRTVAKAVFSTLSMSIVLIFAIVKLWNRFRPPAQP